MRPDHSSERNLGSGRVIEAELSFYSEWYWNCKDANFGCPGLWLILHIPFPETQPRVSKLFRNKSLADLFKHEYCDTKTVGLVDSANFEILGLRRDASETRRQLVTS
jgi:hypothetical protein